MTVTVSKESAYAVLTASPVVSVSKEVGYAVLQAESAVVISKEVGYAVMGSPFPGVLHPLSVAESITTGEDTEARLSFIASEIETGGNSVVRCSYVVVEVFHSIPVEGPVATDVLPISNAINAPLSPVSLRGLSYSVHKKPRFLTTVNSAVSGKELRTSRMQYPIYEFEVSFEFLDERDGETDLQQLMGFFMTQRGAFGAWLYQDVHDYKLQGASLGTGDGGTTAFPIMRNMGGFSDPIGQVDLSALFNLDAAAVNTTAETITVPDHGLETGYGPVAFTTTGGLPDPLTANGRYYLIVVDEDTLQIASSYANALAGTAVNLTTQGTGTHTGSNSINVYDDGTPVDPDDYEYSTPYTIVFDSAPSDTNALTIDCKYYFVCRFMEDIQDFEEFMNNLWTAESMQFQSIIQ